MLEEKVGKAEAARLIVAVTDASRGALRSLATDEGYDTFVIDDNVGGRFMFWPAKRISGFVGVNVSFRASMTALAPR